jgi:hypothetical protein
VTYNSAHAADGDALFAEPALGGFAAALQDDGVALQAAGDVVPGGCDELVFAAQVLDFLLEFGLEGVNMLLRVWDRKGATYRSLFCGFFLRGFELGS